MEPDRKAMPPTESIRRELIRGTLWSGMVEQHGWVGHSVTRVKCNEMRSLELFNAGGTADNTVYSPRDVYYILGLFCAKKHSRMLGIIILFDRT